MKKFIKKRYIISLLAIIMVFSLLVFKMNYSIYYVSSESMEPTIEAGSIVIASRNNDEYNIKDIAIYERNGMRIIHRIIDINEDGSYVFKGDNNEYADSSYVERTQIIGKSEYHSRILGIVYKNITNFLFLFVVLLLIFLTIRNYIFIKDKYHKNVSVIK